MSMTDGEFLEREGIGPWNAIKKLAHDYLGWHKPMRGPIGFDGCSLTSTCRYCGSGILQDSQGNWFTASAKDKPESQMSDKPASETPSALGCAATPEDLCAGALRHYDELSTKACSWMNQIPQAIRFWYLGKPTLERALHAAEQRAERLAGDLADLRGYMKGCQELTGEEAILAVAIKRLRERATQAEQERDQERAARVRAEALLLECKEVLYNPFEPDNQSRIYQKVSQAIAQEGGKP